MKRDRTKAEWAAYMREWQRNRKAKDPEAYRKSVRQKVLTAKANGTNGIRQLRANRLRQDILDAIKRAAGCADCGTKSLPPECYDFDHRPEEVKRFQIGTNRRREWGKTLDEIGRCDVVCANCHRIRTVARKRAAGLRPVTKARPTVDHVGRWRDLWAEAEARGLLPRRN